MNNHTTRAEIRRKARPADIVTDPTEHHYGRRVERDGSWSIYHVFSGIPAMVEGRSLTGMSRTCATEGMLAMNRRNDGLQRQSRR